MPTAPLLNLVTTSVYSNFVISLTVSVGLCCFAVAAEQALPHGMRTQEQQHYESGAEVAQLRAERAQLLAAAETCLQDLEQGTSGESDHLTNLLSFFEEINGN